MVNLCGEFSPSFVLNTKFGKEYFNKKGKLNNMIYCENFNESSLSKTINKVKTNSDIVDQELCDLIIKMLKLEPNKRISLAEILKHKWLTN